MRAFIPAEALFQKTVFHNCEGIAAYETREAAGRKTGRRHIPAKNRYYSVVIPDRNTFIDLNLPMDGQPPYVLQCVLSAPSLSLLFTAEEAGFMDRLGAYLAEKGSPDGPEEALRETAAFYDAKREIIKGLGAEGYLELIKSKITAAEHKETVVSSYLSQSGISGLIFRPGDAPREHVFLLFNPRRDALIKEIIRAVVPETRPVA
jgi:hypothetical protein